MEREERRVVKWKKKRNSRSPVFDPPSRLNSARPVRRATQLGRRARPTQRVGRRRRSGLVSRR